MPRGDGTGPMGMGPLTGRGAGFCAGFAAPGYMNLTPGYGIGFGRGRGFRRMFYLTGMPGWARYGYPVYDGANAPATDEKEILSNQAEFLENQLQQVKKRLNKLNDETE
jgi:hypothetical protein